MSGSQQGAAGASAAGCFNYSVTLAIPTPGFTGFISGSGGAITPATLKGTSIDACGTTFDVGPLTDFEFSLAGSGLSQAYFRGLLVLRTNGTWVRYNTATATTYSSGSNTWAWGTGSNPVWTAAPATRALVVYP